MMSNAPFSKPCKICLKEEGKYTCPRCNITYCSLECYKSEAHAECSETFYKNWVLQGLKHMKSGSEEKEKVLSMLQRLEDDTTASTPLDDVPEEDESDLAARLTGLNLDKDTDLIWQQLTHQEKREFHAMLRDGRLGNMLDIWQPWWLHKDKVELVKEIDAEESIPTDKPTLPRIMKDIPHLKTLLPKSDPSPCIQFSIVNVLYAFAYVSRLHNGELMACADQALQSIEALCGALGKATYQSVSEAVYASLEGIRTAKELCVSEEFCLGVLHDLRAILEGPSPRAPQMYALAALSQLHTMVHSTRRQLNRQCKELKSSSAENSSQKLVGERKHLFSIEKKVEFFLSWTQNCSHGCKEESLAELDLLICETSTELACHSSTKEKLEQTWKDKQSSKERKLIEEITES